MQPVRESNSTTLRSRVSNQPSGLLLSATGCGSQRLLHALRGVRILLAAAPTTPPCFCRRQRSSLLLFKSPYPHKKTQHTKCAVFSVQEYKWLSSLRKPKRCCPRSGQTLQSRTRHCRQCGCRHAHRRSFRQRHTNRGSHSPAYQGPLRLC